MAVDVTAELSAEDRDTANDGLRSFVVSIGEKNLLSDWFGVGVRTIERWFADAGRQFRPCIPAAAVGKIVYELYDEANPTGAGRGQYGGVKSLQSMRYRIHLCALLTQGETRPVPTFIDTEMAEYKIWETKHENLRDAIKRYDDMFSGRAFLFYNLLWVDSALEPDGEEWKLTIGFWKPWDSDLLRRISIRTGGVQW